MLDHEKVLRLTWASRIDTTEVELISFWHTSNRLKIYKCDEARMEIS